MQYHTNINQIKQKWVYFLSDKDFQKRKLLRHNYIMVKDNLHITILNAPNHSTEKHMKQKLTELKGEINNISVIFEDFGILLSRINRTTTGQKICKGME